jgi:hypothetical protein
MYVQLSDSGPVGPGPIALMLWLQAMIVFYPIKLVDDDSGPLHGLL